MNAVLALKSMAIQRVSSEVIVPEEHQWISRAKSGDETAFRWLLNRHRDRVVRLAACVLQNQSEAEDVAQEAFVKAFRGISKFRGDGRFYTWIYHITLRICLDRKRLSRWNAEASLNDAFTEAHISNQDTSDTRILVQSLIRQLNPKLRAVLVLRELEGLEYDDIAYILKIPVGTVRSRLNYARNRFRTMWESAMKEEVHV